MRTICSDPHAPLILPTTPLELFPLCFTLPVAPLLALKLVTLHAEASIAREVQGLFSVALLVTINFVPAPASVIHIRGGQPCHLAREWDVIVLEVRWTMEGWWVLGGVGGQGESTHKEVMDSLVSTRPEAVRQQCVPGCLPVVRLTPLPMAQGLGGAEKDRHLGLGEEIMGQRRNAFKELREREKGAWGREGEGSMRRHQSSSAAARRTTFPASGDAGCMPSGSPAPSQEAVCADVLRAVVGTERSRWRAGVRTGMVQRT